MSEFACPECGAASPAGAKAGTPYACPACRNPVLPVARRAPPPPPAPAPARPPRAPWKVGVVVFVVLAASYLGVYELLTAEAKHERDRLLARHGSAITTFEDPVGPPQSGDAAAMRAYTDAHGKFEDRQAYERRVSRIDAMFVGLIAAFGAQVLLTGVLLAKTALARRSASARGRSRAATRAARDA